ncbi:hypothetical protein Q2463_25175, partial [Escherichia coli]|nr:hypothetical protein [Escherichia coli]
AGGGVEMGHDFALIAVEAVLQVVHLALHLVRRGVGQQAGDQKTDGDPATRARAGSSQAVSDCSTRILPL